MISVDKQKAGSIKGHVYQSGTFVTVGLEWRDGLISDISPCAEVAGLPLIVPRFIDLHCHGGGGADFMAGGDAAHVIAQTHAKHGTKMLLATTMTAPVEDIEKALRDIAYAMNNQATDEAHIHGVHLEGPFISRDQLGAQPDFVQPATIKLAKYFCELAPLKVVTMAPEADPDRVVSDWFRHTGIRVQIGHTACNYETARNFLEFHSDGATHLFNAMSSFHHRQPGCVGACLGHAKSAELISDLLHIHEGAIHAACRAIPTCYAVTDATAAAGMPDGEYQLGRQTVTRRGNAVRLESGALAGSCLTMDEAFKNLLACGFSPEETVLRTSTYAAQFISYPEKPLLAVGGAVEFAVLESEAY